MQTILQSIYKNENETVPNMCNWIINCVLISFLHFNSFNTLGLTETIDEIVIEFSDGDNTGAVSAMFPNLEFVDKVSFIILNEKTYI